jgi:hypothetical protein
MRLSVCLKCIEQCSVRIRTGISTSKKQTDPGTHRIGLTFSGVMVEIHIDTAGFEVNHRKHTILANIIHLNDSHRWSREDIADWLDTLDVDLTIKRSEVINYGTGEEGT